MAIVCARSKATHYLFTALFYNVVGEGPSIVNVFFVCVCLGIMVPPPKYVLFRASLVT